VSFQTAQPRRSAARTRQGFEIGRAAAHGPSPKRGLEHPVIARPKGGVQLTPPALFFREDVMGYVRPPEPKKVPQPAVQRECICRNHHRPDAAGFVYTSPSCLRHGPRSPYITHDGQSGFDVVWDDRTLDGPERHDAKPDAHADAERERLSDAVGQCGKRLFADGAAN
jgi:hypothetical protein